MGQKIKKLITILLLTVMSLTVIGCGESAGNDVTPDGTNSAAPSGEQKNVELRITAEAWMYGKYDFDSIKEKFEADHPGVTVVYNKVDTADVTTNMLQWATGKTDCDIAIGGSREDAVAYVVNNYIIPFEDDFFSGEGFTKDDYYESFLELGNIEGTQYMIPICGEVDGISVNKQIFAKAGLLDGDGNIIPAKTWDELSEYAKKTTIIENGSVVQTGLSIDFGTNNGFQSYLASLRGLKGTLFGDDGTTIDFVSDDAAYLLNTWKKLIDNKYTPTDTFSDNDAGRTNFKAGKVAMLIAPASRWIECQQNLGKENVGLMPIPGTDEKGSLAFIQGAVIPTASENQDLAKAFIKEGLLDTDFMVGAMNNYGKMSPLKAHYEKLENPDWPILMEMTGKAATAPLYKEYDKLDTMFLSEFQKFAIGQEDIAAFQANMAKIVKEVDLTTGLNEK